MADPFVAQAIVAAKEEKGHALWYYLSPLERTQSIYAHLRRVDLEAVEIRATRGRLPPSTDPVSFLETSIGAPIAPPEIFHESGHRNHAWPGRHILASDGPKAPAHEVAGTEVRPRTTITESSAGHAPAPAVVAREGGPSMSRGAGLDKVVDDPPARTMTAGGDNGPNGEVIVARRLTSHASPAAYDPDADAGLSGGDLAAAGEDPDPALVRGHWALGIPASPDACDANAANPAGAPAVPQTSHELTYGFIAPLRRGAWS